GAKVAEAQHGDEWNGATAGSACLARAPAKHAILRASPAAAMAAACASLGRKTPMSQRQRATPKTAAGAAGPGSAVKATRLDFENLHEIVRKARQNLDQNNWDYIVGGTESETTLRRNRLALDSVAFRPRVLRDVSRVDAAVSLFGRRLRLPLLLAPVGALESFDESAAAGVARAAGEFGVAHMMSSVSKPGLE